MKWADGLLLRRKNFKNSGAQPTSIGLPWRSLFDSVRLENLRPGAGPPLKGWMAPVAAARLDSGIVGIVIVDLDLSYKQIQIKKAEAHTRHTHTQVTNKGYSTWSLIKKWSLENHELIANRWSQYYLYLVFWSLTFLYFFIASTLLIDRYVIIIWSLYKKIWLSI